MTKREIVDKLIARLQEELEAMNRAVRSAHEAATNQEAKAENQYDTRGLEASYLAGAQAQRALDIQAVIASHRQLPVQDFEPGSPIRVGSLVDVELEAPAGRPRHRGVYLLVTRGGGASVELEGQTVHAIATASPLGEALLDRRAGDEVEIEAKGAVKSYSIVSSR